MISRTFTTHNGCNSLTFYDKRSPFVAVSDLL
jgi:hypothetical protein